MSTKLRPITGPPAGSAGANDAVAKALWVDRPVARARRCAKSARQTNDSVKPRVMLAITPPVPSKVNDTGDDGAEPR